jgi:DNA-binding transcriptional regulator YdaS (Cro superfamily)
MAPQRHPIARELEHTHTTARDFANLASLSESLISQIMSGRRSPGAEAIRRIVKASSGRITERELLWWNAAA